MQSEKCEGIVLRSQEYKERERIVSIFSREHGVISLIAKGMSRKKPELLAATTPFCIADFCFLKGRSSLFRLQDAAIKKNLLILRSNLAHLQAAAEMTKAVYHSQLPEKDAPALYALLKAYLLHLPDFMKTEALLSSFYLKILVHEGLLSPLDPPPIFQSGEWEELLPLLAVKTFEQLKTFSISPKLLSNARETFFSLVHT